MKKLQNFNQKILAIVGSLAVLLLTGFIVFFSYLLIKEFGFLNDPYVVEKKSITLVEKRDQDNNKARDQVISFKKPVLIDTLSNLYVIPVNQVNLSTPEKIANDFLGHLDTFVGDYDNNGIIVGRSGFFNNLLLYHQQENKKTAVLNHQAAIFWFKYVSGNLLFEAVTEDTNQDGELTEEDLKVFYNYHFEKETLHQIAFENMSFIDYSPIYKTEELILRYGLDKNEDGEFDSDSEPVLLKSYHLGESKAKDFIDSKTHKTLQDLID